MSAAASASSARESLSQSSSLVPSNEQSLLSRGQEERPPKYSHTKQQKQQHQPASKSKTSKSGNDGSGTRPYIPMIDIGANLLDDMFKGKYHGGGQKHQEDLSLILARARSVGVNTLIVTAGNLSESRRAIELCQKYEGLYCTVGVHPTRSKELDGTQEHFDAYMRELESVAEEGKRIGKVVAIGECGLDYDRLFFSSKEQQLRAFPPQILLAQKLGLPLFLHDRNTGDDFRQIFKQHHATTATHPGGVVHSFTGTIDDLKHLLDLNLYIGINGCSLKTEENLLAMAAVPEDRLMIETDCPWCEVKNTHSGSALIKTKWPSVKAEKYNPGESAEHQNTLVKSRCEPCQLVQVLEIISEYRKRPIEELGGVVYANTIKLFFPAGLPALSASQK